ncbi:MAG: HIT family protein [Patescibacteria group bacterium]|nr:HIT family protein [Patescibacteria group bacterium]MDE2438366.1 HIT family protein [Patescibacteria group bacterium]
MSDCLFCRIICHDIRAHIIFEDDAALAFLDVHPRTIGHTLVVPRLHVATLRELPHATLAPYFSVVQKVAVRIEEVLRPEGMTIGMNQGRASGQEVAHLHTHLMPRFVSDGGGSLQSVVHHPPQEDLTDVAKKLKMS